MGNDKWTRRKPGRVSGTVVPPPPEEDGPSLQRRRSSGRPRLGRDEQDREAAERREARRAPDQAPVAPAAGPEPREEAESVTTSTLHAEAEPEVPQPVRQIFPPVLRPTPVLPAGGAATNHQVLAPGGDPPRPPAAPSPASPVRRVESAAADPAADRPPVVRSPVSPAGPPALSSAGTALAVAWGAELGRSRAVSRIPARSGWSVLDPDLELRPRAWLPPRTGLRSGQRGGRQALWMITLTVLLLLTAAGTTVALMRQPAAGRPGPPNQKLPAVLGAGAARSAAAAWVSGNINRSEFIGCDTVMCSDLLKAGVPSSDLIVLRSNAQDPLGVGIVVATSDLQSLFGTRLRTEYAPTVLASFGHGQARVDVRLVATAGAAAYEQALRRDLAARKAVGGQLIANKRITLSPAAAEQLAAGNVDPRLLIILPALATQNPIQILAFFDRAPRASPGVPLAGVELLGADPQAGLQPHAYLRWLTSLLRNQRSVYRAASVSTATHHGLPVVSIRFTWPTPIGLLH
jgi:hypothetical protein